MSDHTAESCLERARTIITLRAQLAERDEEVERLTADKRRCHGLLQTCETYIDLTGEPDDVERAQLAADVTKELTEGCEPGKCTSLCDERAAELEAENATLRAALEESMRVLQVAAERAIDMGNAVVALGGADINRGQFLSLVEETWRTQRAALTAKEGKG
jgi:hypothetical protein